MPGPSKKPEHWKVISGTARPCRPPDNALDMPLVEEVPEPPDWLQNIHAVKEFNRLAKILYNNQLLTEAAITPLAHLCGLHGKIAQLWAAGESPTGHLVSQYRGLINDFGLTPVAAGKLGPNGNNGDQNPYEGRPAKPPPGGKKKTAKKKATRKKR